MNREPREQEQTARGSTGPPRPLSGEGHSSRQYLRVGVFRVFGGLNRGTQPDRHGHPWEFMQLARALSPSLRRSGFGFVSGFEIRISDLAAASAALRPSPVLRLSHLMFAAASLQNAAQGPPVADAGTETLRRNSARADSSPVIPPDNRRNPQSPQAESGKTQGRAVCARTWISDHHCRRQRRASAIVGWRLVRVGDSQRCVRCPHWNSRLPQDWHVRVQLVAGGSSCGMTWRSW